jgi:tape measure domain-containing protein
MDSVLKFIIKLQADQGNVVSVTTQTSQELDNISRKAKMAGARIRQAFSFSNFKSSLMAIPGMQFLSNPYVLASAGVGAIAKIGAQTEKTTVAFEVLVGSERKAVKLLKQINDFAAATPFSTMDLEKSAQMMLNFGISSKSVMTYLKELGDISMGDANKLQSLSLVFGQMSAAGKLQGQDNMQFISAGFAPLKELQKMTGKSYKELQEMMSKGQITSNAVAAALKHATEQGGLFHGMMQKTAQTVLGKLSTAFGNLIQKARDMFKYIKPAALFLIDNFQNIASHIMDIVEKLFQWIASSKILKSAFSGVLTIISNLISWLDGAIPKIIKFFHKWGTEIAYVAAWIGIATIAFNLHNIVMTAYYGILVLVSNATKIWAAVQTALNFVLKDNPVGLVITVIALLTTAVVYCWNKFAGFRAVVLTVWDTMKGFGNIIKTYVIDRISTLLSGLGKVGDALSKLFKGDYKGAWKSAVSGFKDIAGISTAKKVTDDTKKLISGVSSTYEKNYKKESKKDTADNKKEKKEKSSTNTIATPGLKGSKEDYSNLFGKGDGKKKKKGGRKTAEEMATGGTRNTSINVRIGKFFDSINVMMADKTDTAELQRIIVETMNRALAIATSTDR